MAFEDNGQGAESPEQQLKRLIGIASQPQPEAPAPAMAPAPSAPPVAGGLSASAAPVSTATPGPIAMPNQSALAVKPPSAIQNREAAGEAELSRLQKTGSGVDQLRHKHPVLGTIAKIGDVALQSLFPRIAMNVPGTEAHHQVLEARQQAGISQAVGEQEHEAQANAAGVGKTPEEQAFGSLLSQINPETGKLYTAMEAFQKVGIAKQDVKPDAKPDVIETAQGPLQFNPDSKQWEPVTVGGKAVGAKEGKENDFEQYYSDYLKDNNLPDSAHNRLRARRDFAAAGQAPQRDPRQLAVGPDGTVIELKPGMKIPQGSKTMAGDLTGPKTTADEQRRADLAENMNENLNQLEEIAKRRPDLFGPFAGRLTSGRMAVGTGDPDVAALKTVKEQLGMAMVGAHAMRNAQHVAEAANSILNGFNNEPAAMLDPKHGSIAMARKSLQTFQQDVDRGKPKSAPSEKKEDAGGVLKYNPETGRLE